jgi:DNA-binding transcriptional ArsR family regulator
LVFGARDLQRVRLLEGPEPMWELVLALVKARSSECPVWLARWHDLRGRLESFEGPGKEMLTALVPPRGDFPDFLTPAFSTDLDAGCEAVALTSRARFGADLATVFARRPAPPWSRMLAEGDHDLVLDLVTGLRTAFDVFVAPQWGAVQEAVASDRAFRLRLLGQRGVGCLLAGIPGVVGWDGSVLTVSYPRDRTVCLDSRGLMLAPSYFCSGDPVSFIDPALPPLLVYPAVRRAAPTATVPAKLIPLLGRTRAECLHALRSPATTSDLARRLGLSIGTASKQATVLRDGGLVATDRHGGAVLHRLTPLGGALLAGID